MISVLVFVGACGGHASHPTAATLRVVDANLPYQIVDARTGRSVPTAKFWSELSQAQAVCIGESHDNPHHHWAQLEIIERLATGAGEFAIGMEMFQRPFQGVLDDFVEGAIDETQLLSRSDWKTRWSYDWELYAPILRHAKGQGARILALNVSNELKEKWKRSKLANFSESELANFPELDLHNEQHRRWFRSLMEGMGEGHKSGDPGGHAWVDEPTDSDNELVPDGSSGHEHGPHSKHEELATQPEEEQSDFIDTIYPVQVLWDETMADTASKWLLAGDNRRLVILAGHGHCHDSAIVGRMKRRGVSIVLSVKPVVESGEGEMAGLLANPVTDYLFVMDKQ